MIKETLGCGPLQQVTKTPVSGVQVGIFTNTKIELGYDYELAPVVENGAQVYYREREFNEGGAKVVRRFGSQAVIVYALPNVSGGSSFQIGGAGTNGGATGGAGASSAMQRIVDRIIISVCELPGAYRLEAVVTTSAAPVGPTAEDVLAALAKARILLNIPTSTLVRDNTPCKMETFTDAAGKPVTMCRGPQGSYQTTRVVPGSVPVTGTIDLGVGTKIGPK